jgi:hypothetical protein
MTYLNLLLISVIVVCIIDLTDFASTIKKVISFIITRGTLVKDNYRLHFVDCSLCVTFWAGLLYLVLTGGLSIQTLATLLVIAVNTNTIYSILKLIMDIINIIIKKIYGKIN